MTLMDKAFRIGLLLLGLGFLCVYAYYRSPSHAVPNHPRFVTNVGNYGNGHIVYLTDTQEGLVFYAERTGATDNEPLIWKTSQPQMKK